MCPSWSPPETKDSAIDSPDAQRQEWFAQYFSFWSTTDLQTQRFSMSTELLKKKREKEKTDEKKQTKNWKKSSNYLLFIVIDRFGDQSTLESVDRNCKSWFENRFSSTCRSNAQNLMSLISTSGRNATIFHFLPLTETKVNWTRPRHQMSSLRSDLIVWFSLIVSLWRSFSRSTVTMIIRMFDVYFIPLLFDLFCSFLELE